MNRNPPQVWYPLGATVALRAMTICHKASSPDEALKLAEEEYVRVQGYPEAERIALRVLDAVLVWKQEGRVTPCP